MAVRAFILYAAQIAMLLHAQMSVGAPPAPAPSAPAPPEPPATDRPLPPDAALPEALHAADTYRLWAGRAPDAKSDAPNETPTLTWFAPPFGKGNGTAVVVAPGGGYVGLAAVLSCSPVCLQNG